MREIFELCVSHVHRWRDDPNRGVQDALFNLSRDSFGTFGVFLCVVFGLDHVAYGTTFQGAPIVSVSSVRGDADLDAFFREKCLGNKLQP